MQSDSYQTLVLCVLAGAEEESFVLHIQNAFPRVHYACFFDRIFPVKDVPAEPEALTHWLYQRFIEKEDLLTHFYETGRMASSKENCALLLLFLTRISKRFKNTYIFFTQYIIIINTIELLILFMWQKGSIRNYLGKVNYPGSIRIGSCLEVGTFKTDLRKSSFFLQ